MATAREIQEAYPEQELVFLPNRLFDAALIGVGERARSPMAPVYSFNKARLLVDNIQELSQLWLPEVFPQPIIYYFLPMHAREEFWKLVQRQKLAVWEQLDPAIIGTARQGLRPEAVAYSYPRAVAAMRRHLETSDAHKYTPETYISDKLQRAWIGNPTPYFIYPVQ